MLLLTTTTDKLQIVTSAAVAVDVHASFMDYGTGGAVTPGRQNTAIVTATTTDIVAVPGGSTQRNIKHLQARNKGVANTDVTVQYNQNGTLFELHKVTLSPDDALMFADGVGFFKISASASQLGNGSTADVPANAADTYLAGASVTLAGRQKAGTVIRWRFTMTKTAAGTAAPITIVRGGTTGTTADAALVTLTGVAQTGAIDTGWWELEAVLRNVTATGAVEAVLRTAHKNTTTGLQNLTQDQLFQGLSGSVDLSSTSLIVGVSINPGSLGVWTFQSVSALAFNLG